MLQWKASFLLLGLADLLADQAHQLTDIGSLYAFLLLALNVVKGRSVTPVGVKPDVDAEHEDRVSHGNFRSLC